jgi:hypothetical protein
MYLQRCLPPPPLPEDFREDALASNSDVPGGGYGREDDGADREDPAEWIVVVAEL